MNENIIVKYIDCNDENFMYYINKSIEYDTENTCFGNLPKYEIIKKLTMRYKNYAVMYEQNFIGIVSIKPFRDDYKTMTMLLVIDKSYRGKGIGKYVTNVMSSHIFDNMPQVTNITLEIKKNNEASISTAFSSSIVPNKYDKDTVTSVLTRDEYNELKGKSI